MLSSSLFVFMLPIWKRHLVHRSTLFRQRHFFMTTSADSLIKGMAELKTASNAASTVDSTISDTLNPNVTVNANSPAPSYKIYTRTGDKGTTSLYSGERRAKTDAVFEALGTVDELSSFIGMSVAFCRERMLSKPTCYKQDFRLDLLNRLIRIQCLLQDMGSHIATPRTTKTVSEMKLNKTQFDQHFVLELENWIDEYDKYLPKLTQFILPSGDRMACSLHVCRSVCRRAERNVVSVVNDGGVDESVLIYLNRLSDFFFNAARFVCMFEDEKENIYIKPKTNNEL